MTATPVHPELRRVARVLPRGVAGPGTVRAARVVERMMDRITPPPGATVERAGAVTVRVHRPPTPSEGPLPAVLWIHGGGYVLGHAAQDDRNCQDLAHELGAVVAAVHYRLAPEHPYPTALEDCHDALVWLASQDGVDEARVAIAGASAGGGLAAALALEARDRGEVRPVFQSLTYPMLDDRTTFRPGIDERGFRLWTNRSNRFGWRCYLGTEPGFPGVAPTAAPGRAEDLSGLPPAWIGVGTLDLFHGEDVDYARRLRDAGVPCELDVVDGAFHGFELIAPRAPVSQRFRASQLGALDAALNAAPGGS